MVKRYRKIESVDQDDDDESEEVTDQKVGLYCCLCDQKVCFSCHEQKNKGHECDEDTVATVKLLRKDSKACPKCAIIIFKISGCNQMYCSGCHTVFDWKSGKEEKGVIHNPHAIQWMKNNGKINNPNQLMCQNERLHQFKYESYQDLYVYAFYRAYTETVQYKKNKMERSVANGQAAINKINRKFILSEIDEKTWTQRLFAKYRAIQRAQTWVNLADIFIPHFIVLFNDYIDKEDGKDPKEFGETLERTVKEINQIFVTQVTAFSSQKTVKESADSDYFFSVRIDCVDDAVLQDKKLYGQEYPTSRDILSDYKYMSLDLLDKNVYKLFYHPWQFRSWVMSLPDLGPYTNLNALLHRDSNERHLPKLCCLCGEISHHTIKFLKLNDAFHVCENCPHPSRMIK